MCWRWAPAACVAWLAGCSWVLPHPSEPPPDRELVQCPLDLAQARKDLPVTVAQRGTPALLIIRMSSAQSTGRSIHNGQTVYFVATHHDVTPALSLPAAPAAPGSIWQVEAIDSSGGPLAPDSPLSDASLVRLQNPTNQRYLSLANDAQSFSDRGQAESFSLFKADVPDSTRPSTCDTQLRDGDFVFVRTVARQSWVGVSDTGQLFTSPGDGRNPQCAQQEERCLTDQRGGLVCAWTPACSP
jgi:hypothetical protein